ILGWAWTSFLPWVKLNWQLLAAITSILIIVTLVAAFLKRRKRSQMRPISNNKLGRIFEGISFDEATDYLNEPINDEIVRVDQKSGASVVETIPETVEINNKENLETP